MQLVVAYLDSQDMHATAVPLPSPYCSFFRASFQDNTSAGI